MKPELEINAVIEVQALPKAEPEPATDERVSHVLNVSGLFWDRDSHGLFDYESRILTSSKT
jgi:hypothetical protein